MRTIVARLKRADSSGPGLARRGRGRGFEYLDESGKRVTDAAVRRAHPRARHPAGVDGRLDLPASQRPHPGRRDRRRRAPPVPVPRRLASPARPGEVRGDGALRPRAPEAQGGCGAGSAAPRARARARPRVRGQAARPRVLPHRHRGLRGDEQDLRPRHHAPPPRDPRRGRPGPLRLHVQGRQAARPVRRRPRCLQGGRGAHAPPLRRGAARVQAGPPVGRRHLRRHQRLHQGGHRGRLLCEGLPHLERDRSRRGRPRGLRRRARLEDGQDARDHAGRQGGRPLSREHACGLPRLVHRSPRLRPLPRRAHDRRGARGARRGRFRRAGDAGRRRGGRPRPAGARPGLPRTRARDSTTL